MTDPPCQTPSVMPATVRTLSGRGALDRARRNSRRQSRPRGHRAVVRRGFGEGSGKDLATRQAGDVLLGGASGASCLLLNTKASQEATCSRAPAAIVPGPEPELRDAGVSRFCENGSHLAEADAGESHAGWEDSLGMSGNAENGSHPAAADFSNEPRVVMWRHTPPRRTESGLLSYGTASPDSSVQKTALWRTRGSS